MYTADTLSRAPLSTTSSHDTDLQELAELAMTAAVYHLPASKQRLEVYRKAQQEDPQCQVVLQYCRGGWPTESDADPTVRAYWDVRGELTECDGLLMRGCRLVVPKALQQETLSKIHEGHQGIVRCRLPGEPIHLYGGQEFPIKLQTSSRAAINAPETTSQTRNLSFRPLSQTTHGNK